VARFGRLDSSSNGIYSYACSLVHSEQSWWGLKSSLHLHVAHTHYGSHYSFRYFINTSLCSYEVPSRHCDNYKQQHVPQCVYFEVHMVQAWQQTHTFTNTKDTRWLAAMRTSTTPLGLI
jgi:hypothetical protein